MTSNQLSYAQQLETARHNKESERVIDSQILANTASANYSNAAAVTSATQASLNRAKTHTEYMNFGEKLIHFIFGK